MIILLTNGYCKEFCTVQRTTCAIRFKISYKKGRSGHKIMDGWIDIKKRQKHILRDVVLKKITDFCVARSTQLHDW